MVKKFAWYCWLIAAVFLVFAITLVASQPADSWTHKLDLALYACDNNEMTVWRGDQCMIAIADGQVLVLDLSLGNAQFGQIEPEANGSRGSWDKEKSYYFLGPALYAFPTSGFSWGLVDLSIKEHCPDNGSVLPLGSGTEWKIPCRNFDSL